MPISSKKRLCFITAPLPYVHGSHIPIERILRLLDPLSDEILLITGNYPENLLFSNKIKLLNLPSGNNPISFAEKIIKHFNLQITISQNIVKVSEDIDIVIFFIGGPIFLIPVITAKLLNKKIILFVPGLSSKNAPKIYSGICGQILSVFFRTVENINFYLADKIIAMSGNLIDFLGLNKFKHKVFSDCTIFIDMDQFKIKKSIDQRANLIGYIGRISKEKGVMNFIKAIPLILEAREDLKFFIGGSGAAYGEISEEIKTYSTGKIKLTEWIPHSELPVYMNEIKLIVAPSFTEGSTPQIVLEAMACGTLVLVSHVASAGLITDGVTGFILEESTPEDIAKKVLYIMNYSDSSKIVNNASILVRDRFSFEIMEERYQLMLNELSKEM